MFLVLIVHADYFSLGAPTMDEISSAPLSSTMRCFFESCSIACVNIFVLISGWFGIHPSLKGFGNFMFQCIYFLFGIYAGLLLLDLAPLSFKGVASCFLFLDWNWFIKAYICLYIISPILNAFCQPEYKLQMKMVLIAYFIFQSFYGWLTHGAKFIEEGYSPLSFIALYVLARYCRMFAPTLMRKNKRFDLIVVIILILAITASEMCRRFWGLPISIIAYTNPLVIGLGLYMVILFSKLKFQNRLINWIARSSFAVFLLHTNYHICLPYFKNHINYSYSSFSGITCLVVISSYLITVFVIAVLLDQPRIYIYNKLIKDKLTIIDDKHKK